MRAWILFIAAFLLVGCVESPFPKTIREAVAGTSAGEVVFVVYPANTVPIVYRGNTLIYAPGYVQHWSNRSVYYFIVNLNNASVNVQCDGNRISAIFTKGSLHSISCYPITSVANETRVIGQTPEQYDENGTVVENATDITRLFTVYGGGSPVARINTATTKSYIVEVAADQFGIRSLNFTFGGVSLG